MSPETRELKFILLVSVLLNLLLFGIVMGHVVRVLDGTLYGQAYRIERMGKLSGPSQKKVKTALEAVRTRHVQEHEKLYTLHEEGENLLAREPFDRAAFLALVKKSHEIKAAIALDIAETAATLALELPPSERIVLSDLMKLPPRPRAAGKSSAKAISASPSGKD